MNEIELTLTGKMEMRDFIELLQSNSRVQQDVRNLIPAEAVNNEAHPIWKFIAFPTLARYDFDLYLLIVKMFKFDNSIPDNLNIWGTLKATYRYLKPELELTTKYSDAFDVYLTAVMDCFDGPEVESLVLQIIEKACIHKTKKKRIEQAKNEIRALFHVVDNNRPRWIQGPEWPMGKHSPMKYISKKRKGEVVLYTFQDVDTAEIRVVEQFY